MSIGIDFSALGNMKRFLEGNWQQIKARLRQKYTHLADRDLAYSEGQEQELLDRLQVKLKMAKDELLSEFRKLITSNQK